MSPHAFPIAPAVRDVPFDGAVTIVLPQNLVVDVVDVQGRRVAPLIDGLLPGGTSRIFTIEGHGLPAGVYFYRAAGERFVETRGVLLATE